MRLLALCLAMSVMVTSAFAEEVVVKDTSGFVRATTEVEGTGNIEFSVTDMAGLPSDGAEITITNETTKVELKAISKNGSVVFEGISPGIWVVASNSKGIVFTSVSISSVGSGLGEEGALSGITWGGAAIGAATLGGATAIAIAVTSSSDNGPPLSPSS